MTDDNTYLNDVLKVQDLDPLGDERKKLDDDFAALEGRIRGAFGMAPHIFKGGSIAKGTLNRESYDLDVHLYFPSGNTSAGDTLEEIYKTVARNLDKNYELTEKRSAIRLQTRDDQGKFTDLHIDVVPGRYLNGTSGPVFLYQNGGDKGHLKTEIEIQIAHVCESGLTQVIRLFKLWKVCGNLNIKTFILELLVIELLVGQHSLGLADQFRYVLEKFSDSLDDVRITDPANKTGNDLSSEFNDDLKKRIEALAKRTLDQIDHNGLQAIFGPLDNTNPSADRVARMQALVSPSNRPALPPWYDSGHR